MKSRTFAIAMFIFAATCAPRFAIGAAAPPVGEVKALGNDRYQVGRIVLDKTARKITVPGRVLLLGQPLEYLAGTANPRGAKNYESMLELDATGIELNLACLLIGLDRPAQQPAYQQFSKKPLAGQKLSITVSWQEGPKRVSMTAAEALLNQEAGVSPDSVDWVYAGSPGLVGQDVDFGVLIGFVHDPNSVIDSVLGINIGAYGSVRGNPAMPPVGTPIEITIEPLRNAK